MINMRADVSYLSGSIVNSKVESEFAYFLAISHSHFGAQFTNVKKL